MKNSARGARGEALLSVDLKKDLFEKFMNQKPLGLKDKDYVAAVVAHWCEIDPQGRHALLLRLGPDHYGVDFERAERMVDQARGMTTATEGGRPKKKHCTALKPA
jgi:hypothetical protein